MSITIVNKRKLLGSIISPMKYSLLQIKLLLYSKNTKFFDFNAVTYFIIIQ